VQVCDCICGAYTYDGVLEAGREGLNYRRNSKKLASGTLYIRAQRQVTGRDLKSDGVRQSAYFAGALFLILVDFSPISTKMTIFDPDFSVFLFFSIFDDGILARKMPPCTRAHPKTIVRQEHW
jgi:hypothetical protein